MDCKVFDYTEHEKWMYKALEEAELARKNDEVPIGAIIIKENNIISKGSNQIETLKDATAHAEMIAITAAANTLDDWRLNGCILYVTKQPCLMCMGAILNSRIEQLYYGAVDKDSESNEELLLSIKNSHLKYVEGGILLAECQKIIQKFFLKKR